MSKKYKKNKNLLVDKFILKAKPFPVSYIQRLADEIEIWSECEEALTIKSFLNMYKIREQLYYDWVNKYPDILGESHELALSRLAVRREEGSLTRKYDFKSVEFMMPNYSKDWQKMLEYRTKLKSENEQHIKNQPSVIFVKEFPDDIEYIEGN